MEKSSGRSMCRRGNIRIRYIKSINRKTPRPKDKARNPKKRRRQKTKTSNHLQGYLMMMVMCDI